MMVKGYELSSKGSDHPKGGNPINYSDRNSKNV